MISTYDYCLKNTDFLLEDVRNDTNMEKLVLGYKIDYSPISYNWTGVDFAVHPNPYNDYGSFNYYMLPFRQALYETGMQFFTIPNHSRASLRDIANYLPSVDSDRFKIFYDHVLSLAGLKVTYEAFNRSIYGYWFNRLDGYEYYIDGAKKTQFDIEFVLKSSFVSFDEWIRNPSHVFYEQGSAYTRYGFSKCTIPNVFDFVIVEKNICRRRCCP